MFEMFLNPGYLLLGAGLVSLPIIIHLINRMRYKRVRWAAMEFLLKSQKRNRRRLIIEQLILLALRCALVLLTVILVSRYLGFSFAFMEPQNTLHVIVVDDSLSMTDQWRQEGDVKDCFKTAKDAIKEIAKNAVQARTAQRLVLLTISDPTNSRFDQRLNDASLGDLDKILAELNCTFLRLDTAQGVQAAKSWFDKSPQDKRILHLVSDFRQSDWNEPDGTALLHALDETTRSGVQINLIDAADPARNHIQKTPLFHDNLAITEFRPETKVVAKGLPVPFTVTVANFGTSDRKASVSVKVNGSERFEGTLRLTISPSVPKTETIILQSLDHLGFNQVTANLENEETGLQADNVRYAVVDVRNQVPILVIDGDPTNGMKPGGDSYHVQTLFTAAKGFRVVGRAPSELEQPSLDQYPSIYLLNVRELSERAVKNLENYVRDGGSVAFFMGERVNPDFYTRKLYVGGKGIFPAPLAEKPYPPASDPELSPDLFDGQLKIFVRDETNPIFADVWKPNLRAFFDFLPIKRYYPVPRSKWNREPGQVEEVVTLPNQRSLRDYVAEGQAIVNSLFGPINDPKVEKYKPALQRHQKEIHDALGTDGPLYGLANVLDRFLKDRGETDKPDMPNLAEFWNEPGYQKLKARIERFRDTVQLGDPLVVTRKFGKGRVVAFLTSAGRSWSDWAGGSTASFTFPVVMLELQKYLTSGGPYSGLTVGTPLEIQVDTSRYDTKMHRYFLPETAENAQPGSDPTKSAGRIDLKEQLGQASTGMARFIFDEARKPGVYLFELERRDDTGPGSRGAATTEQRAFAFNVDTTESDLRRAARDDLEHAAGGVKLRIPGTGWASELSNRQNDLSESAWFYLAFLLILVVEQALAVHLSFHVKNPVQATPGKTPMPQPSAA